MMWGRHWEEKTLKRENIKKKEVKRRKYWEWKKLRKNNWGKDIEGIKVWRKKHWEEKILRRKDIEREKQWEEKILRGKNI